MKTRRARGTYPPLPDWVGDRVTPAPDGVPWKKACSNCAYRKGTAEHEAYGMNVETATSDLAETLIFYCVHRNDEDGYDRVCAGHAACRKGAGLKPPRAKRKAPAPAL